MNVYFTEINEQGLIVCLNRILQPEGENQPSVVTCSFDFWVGDESLGSPSTPGSIAAMISPLSRLWRRWESTCSSFRRTAAATTASAAEATHVNYPGSDPWVTCVGGTVRRRCQDRPAADLREWVWSNVGSASAVGASQAPPAAARARCSRCRATRAPPASPRSPTRRATRPATSLHSRRGRHGLLRRRQPSAERLVLHQRSQIRLHRHELRDAAVRGLAAVLRSALGVGVRLPQPRLYQLGNFGLQRRDTTGNNDPRRRLERAVSTRQEPAGTRAPAGAASTAPSCSTASPRCCTTRTSTSRSTRARSAWTR